MEDWMSAYNARRGGGEEEGGRSNFNMTGRGWNPYAQFNNPIFQASMPPPAPSLYQGGQQIYQPKVGQTAPYQQGAPTSYALPQNLGADVAAQARSGRLAQDAWIAQNPMPTAPGGPGGPSSYWRVGGGFGEPYRWEWYEPRAVSGPYRGVV